MDRRGVIFTGLMFGICGATRSSGQDDRAAYLCPKDEGNTYLSSMRSVSHSDCC